MILQTLGPVLPIAVAVAISSVPITVTLVILLSTRHRGSALPFLIGWILGIVVLAVAFTFAATAIPSTATVKPETLAGIIQIVVGMALLAFVLVMWRRSPQVGHEGEPRWLRSASGLGPWTAFGLGVALNIRPKEILLCIALGVAMTAHPLTLADSTIILAIYTAIAGSSVGALVVFSLVDPKRAEPHLVTARSWLVKNNRIVSILIMLMIGVVIVGHGLTLL